MQLEEKDIPEIILEDEEHPPFRFRMELAPKDDYNYCEIGDRMCYHVYLHTRAECLHCRVTKIEKNNAKNQKVIDLLVAFLI